MPFGFGGQGRGRDGGGVDRHAVCACIVLHNAACRAPKADFPCAACVAPGRRRASPSYGERQWGPRSEGPCRCSLRSSDLMRHAAPAVVRVMCSFLASPWSSVCSISDTVSLLPSPFLPPALASVSRPGPADDVPRWLRAISGALPPLRDPRIRRLLPGHHGRPARPRAPRPPPTHSFPERVAAVVWLSDCSAHSGGLRAPVPTLQGTDILQ